MPELPEVQTVVSDLQAFLPGQTLERIEIYDPKVWFESQLDPGEFSDRKLKAVSRRGKYIVYNFGDIFLVQHLRMTGKVLPADSDKIPHNIIQGENPQIRLSMLFDKDEIIFWDNRRFGTVTALKDSDAFFSSKQIAPEIYGEDSGSAALAHYLRKVGRISRPIKSTILDQSIICGPGNIYADEALHRSKIHPLTPTSQLSETQQRELFANLKEVMDEAIAKRGTSASDYLDVNGNPGVFKKYLHVYKRSGLECLTCHQANIERIKVGGRSSHFCPKCQLTVNV